MSVRGALLLGTLLLGAGCVGASRAPLAGHPEATRLIPLGAGIALPAGPLLVSLPQDQAYRFVPPDSLVRGATSEDVASARRMGALRAGIDIVLQSQGWRESHDSAAFELALFVAARTLTRTEEREELVVSSPTSGLPRCDLSRLGNQPRCTNDPQRTRLVRVSVPYTVTRVIAVMRRRSDGAVRFWIRQDADPESTQAIIARDLLRILLTPEG
jgi:hypothetical protein